MKLHKKLAVILVTTTLVLGILPATTTALILLAGTAASQTSLSLSAYLLVGGTLLAFTLVSSASALYLLHRLLLRPMSQLSSAIRTISATNNLSLRVPDSHSPEIAEILGAINNILDTTENAYLDMLKARYEVESANKGKSLFIAKVSHELRTPIHSITGMLRILLKQESAAGKRQYIQMAQDSATSLLETINEILDFSKMQNGELSLEHEQFNLHETLRATIEHLIPRFEEKPDLAFCWDIQPSVPELVKGDATRMRNILINLLGNAFKFADKGHVTLDVSGGNRTSDGTAWLRFSVTDTGIGISTNKLSTIFDPFTTADEGTARLYAGTGLGLAIVKQIADRMGGSISVQSTLGQGSTFSVDLPLEHIPQSPVILSDSADQRAIAILAPSGSRSSTVADGLRRFGCSVEVFSLNEPAHLEYVTSRASSFRIIHIIKDREILYDELAPLLRSAMQHDIPLVLSVPSSEISMSDQLGRSERFFVTLQPVCALDILLIASGRMEPKTSLHDSDETSEKARHKLNILIADDAKTNRIILKTLLEEAGHSVEVVENGKQLLERIAFKPELLDAQQPLFDLVLTDIQMPVMDGLTATQNFRELERQANSDRKLPIVAVTSYAFPEECSKMLASGIDHIITKPINPKRLSRLISQITYSTENSTINDSAEQSDRDIIEELCRLTDNVTHRINELRAQIPEDALHEYQAIVDMQGVFERSGDSLRRTGLILSGFIESYEEPLRIIERASLPLDDSAYFRRTVHSLKGLLLDAGADIAARLAAELEEKAVHDPATITWDEVAALIRATEDAAVVLREIVTALPSLEIYSALPSIEDALTLH